MNLISNSDISTNLFSMHISHANCSTMIQLPFLLLYGNALCVTHSWVVEPHLHGAFDFFEFASTIPVVLLPSLSYQDAAQYQSIVYFSCSSFHYEFPMHCILFELSLLLHVPPLIVLPLMHHQFSPLHDPFQEVITHILCQFIKYTALKFQGSKL